MSDHPRPTRLSRLLARCYPEALRDQYADDIARFIDDARADPRYRNTLLGRLPVALRLTVDALASLVASWRHELPRPVRRLHGTGSLPTYFRSFSMDAFLQDLRFALRGFLRRPGFTAVAIGTLMLGIGANTAIFTLVNAVLLKPLPYEHPEQLVNIWGSNGTQKQLLMSVPDFDDLRARNHTFTEMGIARTQSVNLTGGERPDRVVGNFVSDGTLRLLGAKPALGRLFSAEDTKLGAGQQVVVISHATWQTRFGGRPDMVGQTLVLNGRPHAVIGVTNSTFRDPNAGDVWLPITSAPSRGWFDRGNGSVWGIGRLKPGRTAEDAAKDLDGIARELAKEHAVASAVTTGVTVIDLREATIGNSRFMLMVLFGAVGAVLLIVCVNIANLQLVRASTQQREMSVRAALGAGRARLISQVMTESMLLSLAGGALGVLVGQWGVKALVAMMPATLPLTTPVALDMRVLLFSFATALVTGLLFGAPAALAGTRTNLQGALRARTESASTRRFNVRNTLVVTELSLCIVLLAVAGLFTRSLVALQRIETGFNDENVLSAEFRLPNVKYNSSEKIHQFMVTVLEQLRAIPGVRSAALVDAVPLSGNFGTVSYVAEGQAPPAPGAAPVAGFTSVSDGYFRTMQIPVLEGREFTPADRPGAEPVAIVNKEFAEKAWPGQSAIGRTVRMQANPDVTVRVVGVVGPVKQYTLSETATPQIYTAKLQDSGIFASVVMRTAGDADAMANALRAAIWSVDRDQPVWKVRTVHSLVARDLSPATFSVKLIGAFAVLALLLGVIGVYGVMSFAVAQRTREVGIRMALGARGDQVLQLILRSGVELVLVATVLGVAGALAAGRYLQSRLYNVGAADPMTMIGVPVVLAVVAVMACWLPARRAALVDPAVTLRSE